MKAKGLLFYSMLISLLVITGCGKAACTSGIYGENGKCCGYVCNEDCPNGYVEGTCNCQCKSTAMGTTPPSNIPSSEQNNYGIDIFDDNGDIDPPILPN